MACSKLMGQLAKEQRRRQRKDFDEEELEEFYVQICKLEPKNLLLVEFLSFAIERELVCNLHKLHTFLDIFEQHRARLDPDSKETVGKSSYQLEEQKFTKHKFLSLLRDLAQRLYLGHQHPFETLLSEKVLGSEEEFKIKLDESFKKYLTRDTILALAQFDKELEIVFEAYMPENYNSKLEFTWKQISLLGKKLPIICVLRMLNEAELCPHHLSFAQFAQVTSKFKSASSHSPKEAAFNSIDTMSAYARQHLNAPLIKIIEGDVGLSFFEFQILLAKLATQIAKDNKGDYASHLRKLIASTRIQQFMSTKGNEPTNKLQETVHALVVQHEAKQKGRLVKNKEEKKQIEHLYDSRDEEMKEEQTRNIFKCMTVTEAEMAHIKRGLDDELGELPARQKIEKQNEGFFDVEVKHVIIGEQLPKLQEKQKAAPAKDPKKKPEDALLGFKGEISKTIEESPLVTIVQRQKKLRVNCEYPIILNEVFYPKSLSTQIYVTPRAEVYLEASYINLGERLYQQSFGNYIRAKEIVEIKTAAHDYYFQMHAAQIFESAGRDDVALSLYNKAKDSSANLGVSELEGRALPYIGLGTCLYHLEEYEYALRCFQKAKAVYGLSLVVESVANAILQNNVGCCLMMMNRNQEAVKLFEVSNRILDLKVGRFDERTLVVQQNASKNRKAHLEMMPEFKTMWKTYLEKKSGSKPAPVKAKK